MKTDVFISHSSEDSAVAQAVCAHLESHGIRCWLAPRDVPPGAIWAEAIVDAIADTHIMVLVLTARSNVSAQVLQELERAVNKGIVVIPFRVEDVVLSKGFEYFLGSRHWLDALTPPLERHIEILGNRVAQILAGPLTPPVPSREPARRRGRSLALVGVAAATIAAGIGAWIWWKPPPAPASQPVNVSSVPEPAVGPGPIAPDPNTAPRSSPASPGVATIDAMLATTVWAGALLDSAGRNRECLMLVDRRINERLSVAAYFPELAGGTAQRWNGTLTAGAVAFEGPDTRRQRLALRGQIADDRFGGTWRDDGGRNGTFSFVQVTATTSALLPGTTWRGSLTGTTGAAGAASEFTFRVTNRQREHVLGRCALAGQRGETALVGVLLGDRFIGTMHNVLHQGGQRSDVLFSAAVIADAIAGSWSSEAGFAGTLRCTRE